MAYEYDDYDFSDCEKCGELHMTHKMVYGFCYVCIHKYSLTTLMQER